MDVKPWEPVRHRYTTVGGFIGTDWHWDKQGPEDVRCAVEGFGCAYTEIRITLANQQIVFVKPLSEDRKAARAARKAELAPWIALGQDAADGLIEELRVKGRCDGDPAFRPSRRAKEASR